MIEDLSSEQRQILLEIVVDVNDTLVTQSINIAGQAFTNALKLGCILLFFPVIIVLIVSYLLGKFSLISIFVYGGIGLLLAIVFGAMVATRAKTLAIEDDDGKDVNEEIEKKLIGSDFTRSQFENLANEILGEDSPLRVYLRKNT